MNDGSIMYSDDTFKILGFNFSKYPDVTAQIDYVLGRAASRFFVIRKLAGLEVDRAKLRNIYCSIVRSVLEYSSVTYGPMIAKYQSKKLEDMQKRCLKSIYGYNKSYEELLQEADLETLEERRSKAILKFAQKTAKNQQFYHWFPKNPNRQSDRNSKPYLEELAKSSRLYNSPLFTMRRLLNENTSS